MVNRATHSDSAASAIQMAFADSRESWLTVSEVAAYIHVSRDTIERLIHEGLLIAADVGVGRAGQCHRPRWRIAVSSIKSFLAARATKPPSPPITAHRRFHRNKLDVIEFIK